MTLVIGLLTDQGWPWFPGVDGLDHEDDANQRIEHGYPTSAKDLELHTFGVCHGVRHHLCSVTEADTTSTAYT